MPMFVQDSLAMFQIVEGHAVLTLAVDVPSQLNADGWSVLVKQTLVVADGPGDVATASSVSTQTAPIAHPTGGMPQSIATTR